MTRREAAFSIVAFAAACGFAFSAWWILTPTSNSAVEWRPLDERMKERLAGEEGVTLLVVRMDMALPWDAVEAPFRTKRFHDLMRRHEIVPVLVDGSSWKGDEIEWVWDRYVHSKYPRLIVNVRGREEQTHISYEDLGGTVDWIESRLRGGERSIPLRRGAVDPRTIRRSRSHSL